jgi:hypothetical protein
VMLETTVKLAPLLLKPHTLMTTFPVVAPVGTGTVMLVALQHVGHTDPIIVPLNATVLDPCVAPKFEPEIVTVVPIAPLDGLRPEMTGATATVNGSPLLATLPTFTTMLPDVAPGGIVMMIEVAFHELTVTGTPFSVTTLFVCGPPNPEPTTANSLPTGPAFADSDVITGAGEAAELTDTLSNVAVPNVALPPLATSVPSSLRLLKCSNSPCSRFAPAPTSKAMWTTCHPHW